MSIGEIIGAMPGGILGVAFLLLTLIQIAPIKLDPWSWLGKHVGRLLNGDIMKELKDIRTEQSAAKEEAAKQWAILARTHILRFDDELYNGTKHSKEYFVQQLQDIDNYERYAELHPDFRNSTATAAIEHIRQVYQKCLSEHKFI